MGMTIDEAKEWLKLAILIKTLTQEEFEIFIQSVNLAVDTMEKYQKIEEIVNSLFSNIAKEDERYALEYLGEIKEVLEDGKID